MMSAAAARVVCGAAGSRATQPVTAALSATTSIAAAVSGTRTANGLPGSAKGAESGAESDFVDIRSSARAATVDRTSAKTAVWSTSSSS